MSPSTISPALAAQIFTNNIQVTFLAFAGGMLLGLGTLYVLIQNGLLLGAVAGLAIGAGNSKAFFELILAAWCVGAELHRGGGHGRVAPRVGDRRSRHADPWTRCAPRRGAAVEIVLGTAVWLVVAGLVEGFLTPAGKGLTVVLIVGFGLGALYWGLVLWRRPRAGCGQRLRALRRR